MNTVKVHPLNPPDDWTEPTWTGVPHDFDHSPLPYETALGYWHDLHELIDSEPPFGAYRNEYGELPALGIAKGTPFAPDERMRAILVQAARAAMRRCVSSLR
jgi:hypothetical protein